jgi:ATP-dependent RNA helicase DDX56/DBP9
LPAQVILRLEEDEDDAANLIQYSVRCSEVDKFLLTYVILKLKLIKGKCLIFVNDVDRCYRLKLFLEQFSIKSCVLNSELPVNSRYHVVQEFNKGVYDYIIATDESNGVDEQDSADELSEDEDEESSVDEGEEGSDEDEEGDGNEGELYAKAHVTYDKSVVGASVVEEASKQSSKKRKKSSSPASARAKRAKPSSAATSERAPGKVKGKGRSDREYGVTRGVDFVDVACVVNFDLPTSSRAYTHRVGRTARAGRSGMALSFVLPKEEYGKNKVVGGVPSTRQDERVFARIEKEQAARGSALRQYNFDMRQVEAFRYRMEDALRAVTRAAIREARVKELKQEIINSEKLKAHFEDNPLDLEYLRHDKPLHPTRVQSHMRHVPKYLLPKTAPVPVDGQPAISTEKVEDVGFVPFTKGGARGRGRGRGRGGRGGLSHRGKKKSDPLKKFGK